MTSLSLALLRFMPVLALATVLCAPSARAADIASPELRTSAANAVPACATPGRLMAYLESRSSKIEPRYWGIALTYMRLGEEIGVRWDYAFFQMMVETRSLAYRRPNGEPATVRPEQNNFAGLGATGGGASGESFPDVATGVKAHLEHVLLYSGARIEAPVAERTRQVQAWGIVRSWQTALGRPVTFADLAQKWAPGNPAFGPSIQAVADRFYAEFCQRMDPMPEQVAAARGGMGRAGNVAVAGAAASGAEGGEAAAKPGAAIARASIEDARKASPVRAGLGAPMGLPLRPAVAAAPAKAAIVPVALTPAALPPAPPAPAPLAAPQPPRPLDTADEAVRSLVGGKTVALDTPLGTTVPISFREDGTMTGKAGNLAGMLGAPEDNGRWWAERGRLCQKWGVWFNKEVQCIKIRLQGGIVHWTRDDGRAGTARIVAGR